MADTSGYIAALMKNTRPDFTLDVLGEGEMVVNYDKALRAINEVAKVEEERLTRENKELREYARNSDMEKAMLLDDLRVLMYAFDHPDATALGSRPFKRLRAALAAL